MFRNMFCTVGGFAFGVFFVAFRSQPARCWLVAEVKAHERVVRVVGAEGCVSCGFVFFVCRLFVCLCLCVSLPRPKGSFFVSTQQQQ